jgi:hypothetical protein
MKTLAQLDDVPWDRIDVGGGSSPVPEILRAIATEPGGLPDGGWAKFFDRLLHQSSYYEATVEVVPFLAGFLADPAFAGDRSWTILTLVALAYGDPHPAELAIPMRAALSDAVMDVEPRSPDPLTRLGLLCIAALVKPPVEPEPPLDDVPNAGLGPLAREVAELARALRAGRTPEPPEVLRRLRPLHLQHPLLEGYVDEHDWEHPDDFAHRQTRWDGEIAADLARRGITVPESPPREPMAPHADAVYILGLLFEDAVRIIGSDVG